MYFQVDSRIHDSSFWLGNWPLSCVYLKNEANFPWVILVPRQENVQEIYQLSAENRLTLMNEVAALSTIMHDIFKPEKLNIGALGNIVSQLHIHIVARFKHDRLWPHGVWQPNIGAMPYTMEESAKLSELLRKEMANKAHLLLSCLL